MAVKNIGKLLIGLVDGEIPRGTLGIYEAELLMANHAWAIIEYIELWPEALHFELADRLVCKRNNTVTCFFENIHRFAGINNPKALALKALSNGSPWALMSSGSGQGLMEFDWLDQDIALAIIKAGRGELVAKNPKAFSGLDQKEIVWALAQQCPESIGIFMRGCEKTP